MNYGELKTAVAGWINRSDLTAVVPTFITLAEDRIFWGNDAPEFATAPLRVGAMLTTVNPFSGTSLPSDWTELKRVSWILSGSIKYPLDFCPIEKIGPYEGISGRPQFYSLKGDTIVYGPTFTNDVEIIYYAKPAAMSGDSDTNFLLTDAPSVYLQAALLEAAIYLKDNDATMRHAKAFANALNAYQSQDDGNMHSGSTLRIKSDTRVTL